MIVTQWLTQLRVTDQCLHDVQALFCHSSATNCCRFLFLQFLFWQPLLWQTLHYSMVAVKEQQNVWIHHSQNEIHPFHIPNPITNPDPILLYLKCQNSNCQNTKCPQLSTVTAQSMWCSQYHLFMIFALFDVLILECDAPNVDKCTNCRFVHLFRWNSA